MQKTFSRSLASAARQIYSDLSFSKVVVQYSIGILNLYRKASDKNMYYWSKDWNNSDFFKVSSAHLYCIYLIKIQ